MHVTLFFQIWNLNGSFTSGYMTTVINQTDLSSGKQNTAIIILTCVGGEFLIDMI